MSPTEVVTPPPPAVPERKPDRLDFLRLAMGEVGDRAMLDLARLAIRLAQQVTRVGFAVQPGGRTVYEHYDYEYAMKCHTKSR